VLLAPQDDTLDAWVKHVWPTALKLFIPRFVDANFPELATPEARQAYRQREEEAFGDLEVLRNATAQFLAEIEPLLRDLIPLIEDRKSIGLNDITLWPVLRSLSIVHRVNFPKQVRSYMERFSQKSGVGLLLEQSR
jgi:glutaredoxin 2